MGGVDFRKRILSVLRTTKREKKKRKKESDLPSKPSPLKREAKGEGEEERRRVRRVRREQERQEQQQPSHFVQYASPKTLQPSAFPRLKSSSSSFKEDKDEEEEEEEKNEYVQKPVLSESQLRNIYSSNENKNDGSYFKGHLKEEDALNDLSLIHI